MITWACAPGVSDVCPTHSRAGRSAHRDAAESFPDHRLDHVVSLHIAIGRGFVHNNDWRSVEKGTSEAQQLALASGEISATLWRDAPFQNVPW